MSVEAPERIWVDVKAMTASSVAGRAPFFGVGYVRIDNLEELDAHRRKVIAENERLLYALIEANRKLEELAAALAHANHMQRLTQDARNKAEAALAEKDKEIEALREALEPFARVSDLIDAETEGLSDDDEVSLLFHDYLMDLYTVADFRLARNAGGKDAE